MADFLVELHVRGSELNVEASKLQSISYSTRAERTAAGRAPHLAPFLIRPFIQPFIHESRRPSRTPTRRTLHPPPLSPQLRLPGGIASKKLNNYPIMLDDLGNAACWVRPPCLTTKQFWSTPSRRRSQPL